MPGAGMDPDALEPFSKVLKDGFYEVACIKDMLFTHGDKFHDNKHEYNLGDIANVSIVHYDSLVPKEDREPMTSEVCFDFCRTIPDMGFFGLQNGRMCYCAPYYKAMASDSSQCDAVCDGNPTTMCGGKTKSSIFAMHDCDSTASDLAEAQEKLGEVAEELSTLEEAVSSAATRMQKAAEEYQTMFGKAGDPVAADLFQSAKGFAGELEAAAKKAKSISSAAGDADGKAADLKGKDFSESADVTSAEAAIKDMDKIAADAVNATKGLEKLAEQCAPELKDAADAANKYYPAMYFVDKDFEKVPSTCGGTPSEKPLIGTLDVCARACDNDVHECVGFSFFPVAAERRQPTQGGGPDGGRLHFLQLSASTFAEDGEGVCFLFSKLKTLTYYTKCEAEEPVLLQTSEVDPSQVKCLVKFAKFEGVTLKPDPSGKCDMCLKEAKKADRCFA